MQILFYLLIILALAASAYYGWTTGKRAQNRTETRAQARIRQGLGLVNFLLLMVAVVLVFSLISGIFSMTGNSQLLEAGLRHFLGSGFVLQISSNKVTLFTLFISLLHPLINGGLLLILRGFLKRLYKGERTLETLAQPLQLAGHLLLVKALISEGIFSLGYAGQTVSFFNFGYALVAALLYVLARLLNQEKE